MIIISLTSISLTISKNDNNVFKYMELIWSASGYWIVLYWISLWYLSGTYGLRTELKHSPSTAIRSGAPVKINKVTWKPAEPSLSIVKPVFCAGHEVAFCDLIVVGHGLSTALVCPVVWTMLALIFHQSSHEPRVLPQRLAQGLPDSFWTSSGKQMVSLHWVPLQ